MKFNPSYVGARGDVAALVPAWCRRILDLGCATGSLGALIKQSRAEAFVVGVERDAAMAAMAGQRLDRVIQADIVEALHSSELSDERFDCIILADILEHLLDPWATLKDASTRLAHPGTVVVSLPNVRHYTTLTHVLLRKRWPYRDRGIHDRTHVRFFAQRNVEALFEQAGLRIDRIKRNYRVFEAPYRVNRFARVIAVPPLRDLLTYQYLVVGSRPTPTQQAE